MITKKNPIAITIDVAAAGAIKQINKLKHGLVGIGAGAGIGVAGIGVLGAAMGVASAAAMRHASKLELIQNKTKIVFGDQLGMVQKWSKETASSFGLTAINLEGMAAGFQDLLVPMGFARDEAANMTMDVVGLAGAMSEWSAGTRSVEDTTRILARAMLGEREMLKDLGVDIRELDIKQRLMAKGQEDLTGNFLKQARAVATMEMIFERSKDAQTGFAQGSDTLVRKTRELSSRFQEMVQAVQIQLTPAFKRLIDQIVDEVIPTLEKDLAPKIEDLIDHFIKHLPEAIDKTMGFLSGFATFAKDVSGTVGSMSGAISDFIRFVDDNEVAVRALMTVSAAILIMRGKYVQGSAMMAAALEIERQRYNATIDASQGLVDTTLKANEAYRDFKLRLDPIPTIMEDVLGITDEMVTGLSMSDSELDEIFKNALGRTEDLNDEVKELGNQFKRLTAEQYASAIAAEFFHRNIHDLVVMDEFIEDAVAKLKKLIGEESQIEKFKNQLLEMAGIKSPFNTTKTGGTSSTDGSFLGFAAIDFSTVPHSIQALAKTGEILTKMNKGFGDEGQIHFRADLDPMVGNKSGVAGGLGTTGFTARINKAANELGPKTFAAAMDNMLIRIAEEYNLPEHAVQSLAATMKKQAIQQKVFDFGPVLRGNLPGAHIGGGIANPETDPEDYMKHAPREQIQVPQNVTNINVNGIATEEVVENLAVAFKESPIFKAPAFQEEMFGIAQ